MNEHTTEKVYKRTRPKYIKHWMALQQEQTNCEYVVWHLITFGRYNQVQTLHKNESKYIIDLNIKKL